eukprot:1185516-Prorocentrum_minimum.AAC.1
MKTGWSAKVKIDLLVFQIRAENFLDYVDKRVYKRLQNELAFRNAYFAGRRGMEMDFRARNKHHRKNIQVGLHTAVNKTFRRRRTRPTPQSFARVAHGACSWESWMFTTLVTPAFWTFAPLVYCTTHLEDASGIRHF